MDGITYTRNPVSGPIYYGNTTFEFRVNSQYRNIVKARFDIVNSSGQVVSTIEKYNGEVECEDKTCYMNTSYVIGIGQVLKGKYYVDIGQGYLSLELDAEWHSINYTIEHPNLKDFWIDLRSVFDEADSGQGFNCEVHTDETSCTADVNCKWHADSLPRANCILNDGRNRSEFSRIVFIFLLMAILIAFFNKVTGYDSANPGVFLLIMSSRVFFGSMAGGLNGHGFFYYENFIPQYSAVGIIGEEVRSFVNNWILFMYTSLITAGYIFTQMRRGNY
jgi:hypothetical protein